MPSWRQSAEPTFVGIGHRPEPGPELDLLIVRGNRRVGFEFKLGSAPDLTSSMHAACQDLALDRLWVVHHGKDRFKLAPKVEAVPLRQLRDTRVW